MHRGIEATSRGPCRSPAVDGGDRTVERYPSTLSGGTVEHESRDKDFERRSGVSSRSLV